MNHTRRGFFKLATLGAVGTGLAALAAVQDQAPRRTSKGVLDINIDGVQYAVPLTLTRPGDLYYNKATDEFRTCEIVDVE